MGRERQEIVGDYNQGVELDVMGEPVPNWDVEGIGDFPKIPGPGMCGRDWNEGDSTQGTIGPGRGMIVGACWQWRADIGRNLGDWVRDCRNFVEPHCVALCVEVPWRQCSQ